MEMSDECSITITRKEEPVSDDMSDREIDDALAENVRRGYLDPRVDPDTGEVSYRITGLGQTETAIVLREDPALRAWFDRIIPGVDRLLGAKEAAPGTEAGAGVTLAEVDAGLVAAGEQDRSDEDIALLWAVRAALVGVPVTAALLCFVMGIPKGRADEIEASLIERGFLEPTE